MKGLDCGTGNFIAADANGITLQRNAFITLDSATTNIRQLKLMKVPYILADKRLHVVGKKAYEYAQVFNNQDLRRPMAQGMLSPTEQDALPILKEIIRELIGKSSSKDLVVYSVPGAPIDIEKSIEYHEDVLKFIIESLGYRAESLNEGVALAYVGLADHELTGISISLGSGMCNIAIMYAGMAVLNFSTTKAGDWIDKNVARDTGISKAKAQYTKENGGYSLIGDDERTMEQQAIKTYYEALIRYLLANIAKQFESTDTPNFPKPVPIVLGGGTAMVDGFLEVFQEQFKQKEFPINVSEIKIVDEPLTAVARGCLIETELEEE
jgi:actin-like ATPase involved in cell morphogenesis